ncbi:hypothetical protein [Agriterribacter sp.]|uniref:hypothetical protein n=1 Tax=Agriterribacter sp. TaxID=2821509 RepID=UPI002C73DF41|nr:hypothetical protein [Agriterribacter sp.]HTN08728.1 hypothetical protein [Agriterribacter sp.]
MRHLKFFICAVIVVHYATGNAQTINIDLDGENTSCYQGKLFPVMQSLPLMDEAWDKKFPTHFGTGTEDYYG